jgi:hypothetical protein
VVVLVSGATRTIDRLVAEGVDIVGRLVVPRAKNRSDALQLQSRRWACDNGAYSGLNAKAFVQMLEQYAGEAAGCLFVAAPDVVGDAAATLALFGPWRGIIKAYGYPVALVAQDGLTVATTPWEKVDAIFVGGTTEFKLGADARDIVLEAKRRGLWVHMGRVSTKKRVKYAASIGVDSIDSSGFSKWPDDMLARAKRWLSEIDGQPELWAA